MSTEVPSAPPRTSRVLKANADFVAPGIRRGFSGARWLLGLGLLLAAVAGALIVGLRLMPVTPAAVALPAVVPLVVPVPEDAVDPLPETAGDGNAIVRSPCLDVGDGHCLNADPRLKPAVDLLRGTTRGPDLLNTAADTNVRVRIARAPPGAMAAFSSRTRSVTIDTRLLQYSPRAQAAVLAHELRHVSDWSRVGGMFGNNTLACYNTEASAFQTQAAVWSELRGDRPPADKLEYELEEITQGVKRGDVKFWLELGGDYLEECVGG